MLSMIRDSSIGQSRHTGSQSKMHSTREQLPF